MMNDQISVNQFSTLQLLLYPLQLPYNFWSSRLYPLLVTDLIYSLKFFPRFDFTHLNFGVGSSALAGRFSCRHPLVHIPKVSQKSFSSDEKTLLTIIIIVKCIQNGIYSASN